MALSFPASEDRVSDLCHVTDLAVKLASNLFLMKIDIFLKLWRWKRCWILKDLALCISEAQMLCLLHDQLPLNGLGNSAQLF